MAIKTTAPVYLWTGDGWGKSTSSFGAALRALGHGFPVVIVQFMKGRKEKIGEYKLRGKFGKLLHIEQFGREGWVNLRKPSEHDRVLAQQGFEFAKKAAQKKPFLLILDEINLAVAIGLLKERDVIDFLDSLHWRTHVYLTGRKATPGLRARADFVNEIVVRKGPKKLIGERGIDY